MRPTTPNRLRAWRPAALLASYPLLFAAALCTDARPAARVLVFFTVVAVSYLAELWARRVVPSLVDTLNWVQVGVQLRWVFRELALIVLLARVLSP